MPSKKQLSKIWASQLEYFGGAGQPMQTYGVSHDENNGLTSLHITDKPFLASQGYMSSLGKSMGKLVFDEDLKDLKIQVPATGK